jgi:hypothetical protein
MVAGLLCHSAGYQWVPSLGSEHVLLRTATRIDRAKHLVSLFRETGSRPGTWLTMERSLGANRGAIVDLFAANSEIAVTPLRALARVPSAREQSLAADCNGSKAVIQTNPSAAGQLRPLDQIPHFST